MVADPVSAPHLSVECPGCRRRLRVKAELAGRKVKCPGCGGAINLPRPEPPDALSAPVAAPAEAQPAEPTAGRGPSRPSRRTALIAAGVLLLAAGAAWWLMAPRRLTEPQAKALAEREISRFLRDICSENEATRVQAVERIMPDESFLKSLFGKGTPEVWAFVSKVRDEARKGTANMKREVYGDGQSLDLDLINNNEWQNYKDKPLPAGVWVYTASWRFNQGCDVVVVGRRVAMFREFHVAWIMFGPEPRERDQATAPPPPPPPTSTPTMPLPPKR